MKKLSSLKKISFTLLLVVLLPALFYSGYELSSLSTSEELFGKMYQQQLDAVLFSLNQYAWDAASAWAGGLQNILNDRSHKSRDEVIGALRGFLGQRKAIRTVFVSDSSLKTIYSVESAPSRPVNVSERNTLSMLNKNREKIAKLIDYQRVEYRKIEPIADSASGETPVTLVFIARDYSSAVRVVGIVLDARVFIRDIVSRKLVEAAGDQFILAVVAKQGREIVESTSPVQPGEVKQEKALWLFPDYAVGIRLKGTTINEMVQSRFYRNIVFIIALDIVLLAGAVLIYRTTRKEMDLVRLKSDFVSNVSHELRTPLALIRMFAETLEMKRVKTEKKKIEYYRTILVETERLTRLVNNILNFSRMEADRRQYHFRVIDLNAVVKNVLNVYEYQLHTKGFSTVVQLKSALPLINADDEALSEALHNIVDNAIKYSNGEKFLKVETGMKEGNVFVEVQDRGIGIPTEYHDKIFEKFYRVSAGLVHTAKGSGLGLALVRHIVYAHGGTVEVESSPRKGSTFRIVLPMKNV